MHHTAYTLLLVASLLTAARFSPRSSQTFWATYVEDVLIQPMMEASMMVANNTVARAIRVLLSPLHESKKDPAVDAMLHKLYSPIIWRNLNAANAHVRLHAAGIMADTFPLNDPESEGKEKVRREDK